MNQLFDLGPTRALRPEERSDASISADDFARASYEDAAKVTNFAARSAQIEKGYDSVNDRIKAAIGEELENPHRTGTFQTYFGRDTPWSPDGAIEAWRKRIGELKAKAPDALPWDDLIDEPQRVTGETMRKARADQEEAAIRRGMVDKSHLGIVGKVPLLGAGVALGINAVKDPLGTAAQFGGTIAGQFAFTPTYDEEGNLTGWKFDSPVDVAANLLPFGAGHAGWSLIKNALANGAANAAIQSVLSAGKQADYKAAGLPYGWQVWFEEVEGAAATGVALDLGIRGPGRAAVRRFGRDTPADTLFSRNTERGGVFKDAPEKPKPPEISPETFQKAEQGDIAAAREIAEKTGAIHDPAVKGAFDHLEGAGKLTDEALGELEKMGIVRPDGFRMLADAIEGRVPQAPEPVRVAPEPLLRDEGHALVRDRAGEIDALMREASPLLNPRLAQFIEDAVEAGSARYVAMVREALDGVKAGRAVADEARSLVGKLQEIVRENPERFAAEIELRTSTDPRSIADSVRRFPDLVNTNTSLDTDAVRMGRAIARLDDAAYGKVMEGAVPPQIAALVADSVPALHQARVIDDLARAKPETLAEAKGFIGELVPEGRAEAVPLDGGGARIDDPNGAAAKAHTETLKQEAGRGYEEAVAPVLQRQELESKVETIRGEIAKLEQEAAAARPRYADPETGEVISPAELASIKDMVAFVRDMRKAKPPQSLIDFLRERGGLVDEGTEISTIIDGARSRPGLISKKGQALDDAALAAWEAGFFETAERPTISDFLEAVRRDISGDRVIRAVDAERMEDIRIAREMESELDERGLGQAKTDADVEAHFQPRESGSGARGDQEASGSREGAEGLSEKLAAKRAELAEAQARLDDVQADLDVALGEPVFAGGVPVSKVRKIVESGRTYRVSDDAIVTQFDNFAPFEPILPEGSNFGAWAALGPGLNPGEARVTLRIPGGSEITFDTALDNVLASRAMYIPAFDVIVPSPIVGDHALGAPFASGIYHEVVHAAWSRLRDADKARLVGHAESLRVLDMQWGTVLRALDDPDWRSADPNHTVRSIYEIMYEGRANKQDVILQESVAYMQELHYAGHFSDKDVAPVLNDLLFMRGGDIGARPELMPGDTPTGMPAFAARADIATGQSMRRDLDALGYYSQALEAAKTFQNKGTPEQALAWLKKSGTKDAEIEATGLKAFLEGKQSVTREELVGHLEGNRVGLREKAYGSDAINEASILRDELRAIRQRPRAEQDGQRIAELESRIADLVDDDVQGTKWSTYSLDPDNPTYRETVLHLPPPKRSFETVVAALQEAGVLSKSPSASQMQAWRDSYDAGTLESQAGGRANLAAPIEGRDFLSGHFPEPNIIGHMMTSMTTHQGKPVYTVDQIQSDWGQRLRDDGAKDEVKIATLRNSIEEASIVKTPEQAKDYMAHADDVTVNDIEEMFGYTNPADYVAHVEATVRRLQAELRTAEAATPGNPLVNTTDQWVNTTLRRAIRQAAEADAEYIAIPSGDTVLRYNAGDTDGMRGFYGSAAYDLQKVEALRVELTEAQGDRYVEIATRLREMDKLGNKGQTGIVPKNLRNLLQKLDKASPSPQHIDTLDSPSGKSGLGQGFTLFPLTEKVKQSVKSEGQPLFAAGAPEPPAPPIKADIAFVDRLNQIKDLVEACR